MVPEMNLTPFFPMETGRVPKAEAGVSRGSMLPCACLVPDKKGGPALSLPGPPRATLAVRASAIGQKRTLRNCAKHFAQSSSSWPQHQEKTR